MRSHLSGLAPARRRLAVVVLGALAVALVAGIGITVVRGRAGGGIAEQSTPGPVLVVPGYGGTVLSVEPLGAELRREGRKAFVLEPTGGGTDDLRAQAKRLATLASKTMKEAGADSVDLIGYSAGGVVARLYVRDEGGASVVRRVLTLGSPHHGTEGAAIAADAAGGCPPACEQLVPDSDLLRRLDAGDETPEGPQWVTVRTTVDTVVTPTSSARLSGALNITVQQLCPSARTSHDDLPGDPAVLAVVRSALGVKPPSVPRAVTC